MAIASGSGTESDPYILVPDGPDSGNGTTGPNQGWRPPTMEEAIANPGMLAGGGSTRAGGEFSSIRSGPAGTQQSRDALARMRSVFTQYGLPANVGDWAWGLLQDGKSEDEILLDLYDPSTTGGAAFTQRFPAIQARQKAGLAPISPAEYVAYERSYRQVLSAAGLPPSFYDTADDVTAFITSDVSLAELSDRIDRGYQAVKSAPKEIRDEFARLYGADGDGALASFMLDRAKSPAALEKAIQSSTAAGLGWRQGFQLDFATAQKLGDRGMSTGELDQGFQALKALGGVFNNGQGESDQFGWQSTGVDAVFNNDLAAQGQIRQRVAQRQNAGAAGQGAASGNQGVYGAGRTS